MSFSHATVDTSVEIKSECRPRVLGGFVRTPAISKAYSFCAAMRFFRTRLDASGLPAYKIFRFFMDISFRKWRAPAFIIS